MSSGLLSGKKGLIIGVANDKSIAWGISKLASDHGAQMAFSYQGEVLKKRVEPLALSIGSSTLVECDVTSDNNLDNLFEIIKDEFGLLDFVVHSVAFADKNELRGRYCDTSRAGFAMSMDISCYSLVAIAKRASELMINGGSIVTMTYFGAEKVIPNYNVMGVAKSALETSVQYLAADLGEKNIRINAISSGPIKTLAASGIGDFRSVLSYNQHNAPLRRNVTLEDVAGTAVYLLSDLSSGVTGENIHVDSGYNIIGMPRGDSKIPNDSE